MGDRTATTFLHNTSSAIQADAAIMVALDALEPRDERESEGAYLARHSLLLPGERKRLKKILNRSR